MLLAGCAQAEGAAGALVGDAGAVAGTVREQGGGLRLLGQKPKSHKEKHLPLTGHTISASFARKPATSARSDAGLSADVQEVWSALSVPWGSSLL